jgi:hypothetical protein
MRKPAALPAILAAFWGGVAGSNGNFAEAKLPWGCPEGAFPPRLNMDLEQVRIKLATYKSLGLYQN